MKVFAIDPGPTESGWVIYNGQSVLRSGVSDNREVLGLIEDGGECENCAIEMIASYGMAVGASVFSTCVWVGRFSQAWFDTFGHEALLIYRKDVKMHLCGTTLAKDNNIRQALLDLFPASGGGKTPQIGTLAKPGPLYGVSSHAWPALGVAVTARHRLTAFDMEAL